MNETTNRNKTLPKDILTVIYEKLEMLPFDISEQSLRHQYLDYIKGVIETKSDEWLSQDFIPVVEKKELTRLV